MTDKQHTIANLLRASLVAAGLLGLAACTAPGGPTSDGRSGEAAAQVERYDVTAIRTVQRRLNALGYDAGPVDGAYGPKTRAGILAFQRARGLEPTGVPTGRLLAALKTAPERATDGDRTATASSTRRAGGASDSAQNASGPGDGGPGDGGPAGTERSASGTPDAPRNLGVRIAPDIAAHGDQGASDASEATETAARKPGTAEGEPAAGAQSAKAAGDPDAAAQAPGASEQAAAGAPAAAAGNKAGGAKSADDQGDPTSGSKPDLSQIELTGTTWRIAGGPNRAILVTLKPDGAVDAPVGDWAWQRDGRKIRLSFDSGSRSQSTRTGELVNRDRIEGEARDNFGRSWSWHASRVAQSAAKKSTANR